MASTSQSVSSPMPPPPSPALPPGVPSSSAASAVSPTDVSAVPRGVKRELGGDVVMKGGVKSRRVATITEFEDGRNVMVKVEQDIQMVKGNLVKGSVAFADRELGGLGGGFGDGLGGDGMSGVFGESSGREDPSSGREGGGEDDLEDGELREDEDRGGIGLRMMLRCLSFPWTPTTHPSGISGLC